MSVSDGEILHENVLQFPRFKKIRCVTVHLRAASDEIEIYIALDKQMVIKAILCESNT